MVAQESKENGERRSVSRWLKLIPVCGITAIFRMGSYAMMINWSFRQDQESLALWIFGTVQRDVLLLFLFPVLVLWLLQHRMEVLKPLTTMDIVQGVVGEMATIPVWEKLPTKESRRLNLGMAIYYLLLWSFLLFVAIYSSVTPWTNSNPNMNIPCPPCTNFAIFCLICGCLSFPLFLYQIYYVPKSNLVVRMNVLVSVIYR